MKTSTILKFAIVERILEKILQLNSVALYESFFITQP